MEFFYITVAVLLCVILVGTVLFFIVEFFRDEYNFGKESSNSFRTSTRTSYSMPGSTGYSPPSPPPEPKPRNKYKHIDTSTCKVFIEEKMEYKLKIAEKLIGLLDVMLDYKDIKKKVPKTRVPGQDGIYYMIGTLSSDMLYYLLKNKDAEFTTDYLQILKAMEYIREDGTIPDKKELKEFNILYKKYSG